MNIWRSRDPEYRESEVKSVDARARFGGTVDSLPVPTATSSGIVQAIFHENMSRASREAFLSRFRGPRHLFSEPGRLKYPGHSRLLIHPQVSLNRAKRAPQVFLKAPYLDCG